jgi:hypothetical protein
MLCFAACKILALRARQGRLLAAPMSLFRGCARARQGT